MTPLEATIKGFNAGYLIQKFQPELSRYLAAGLVRKDNPFILGFLLGRREYLLEIGLDVSSEEDAPDRDLGIDEEDLEPDS